VGKRKFIFKGLAKRPFIVTPHDIFFTNDSQPTYYTVYGVEGFEEVAVH